ncbi:hypothetical protein ACWFMI_12650 [Nocardiopsis terrae]
MSTSAFIPGLELSHRFYGEAVRPLLEQALSGAAYSAALLGRGSKVLGCDTAPSRLQVFLTPQEAARYGDRLHAHLAEHLPRTFDGYPTHFAPIGEPGGVGVLREIDGPVRHRVEITDPTAWFTSRSGFDPNQGVTFGDWPAIPEGHVPSPVPCAPDRNRGEPRSGPAVRGFTRFAGVGAVNRHGGSTTLDGGRPHPLVRTTSCRVARVIAT